MPNTHRRRDETVLSLWRRRCEHNSQLVQVETGLGVFGERRQLVRMSVFYCSNDGFTVIRRPVIFQHWRCEHNSQLAHDDCRRIRSTVWKLTKQTR